MNARAGTVLALVLVCGVSGHENRRSALRLAQLPDAKKLGDVLSTSLGRATFGTVDKDMWLCSSSANGNCAANECSAANGNHVECVSGACQCQGGFCADGHGKCLVATPGSEISGTYQIDVTTTDDMGQIRHSDTPTNPLYMKTYGNEIGIKGEQEETPASDQGEWHVVVNNDGTVMMHSVHFGPAYCASIVPAASCSGYGRASWMSFDSPYKCSFHVYADDTDPMAVHLRDVRTGKWFNPQQPDAMRDGLASSRLRFYPALPADLKYLNMHTDANIAPTEKKAGGCSFTPKSAASRGGLALPLLLLALSLRPGR